MAVLTCIRNAVAANPTPGMGSLETCLGLETDSRHFFSVLVLVLVSWSHHCPTPGCLQVYHIKYKQHPPTEIRQDFLLCFIAGLHWPDDVCKLPVLWQKAGDGCMFSSVMPTVGSKTPTSSQKICRYYSELVGAPCLFGLLSFLVGASKQQYSDEGEESLSDRK